MTSRIKGMKMGMEAEIGETIVIVSPCSVMAFMVLEPSLRCWIRTTMA